MGIRYKNFYIDYQALALILAAGLVGIGAYLKVPPPLLSWSQILALTILILISKAILMPQHLSWLALIILALVAVSYFSPIISPYIWLIALGLLLLIFLRFI